MAVILKLIRAEQWGKNLIIFLPLVFAPKELLYPLWPQWILAFVGFCFVSSVTYILNDWRDRREDRLHPIKKNRPLASGAISPKQAFIVALILSAAVIGIGIFLGYFYSLVVAAYFVLTNLYSFGLKKIPLVDSVMIAFNFLLRTLAGVNGLPSEKTWPYFLIVFGVILILLSHKRRSDIKILGEKASAHKAVLRFYTPRNSYILRLASYAIVGFSFFELWKFGVSEVIILSVMIFMVVTSVALSRCPEAAIKPYKLFKLWYWDLVLAGGVVGMIYSTQILIFFTGFFGKILLK